jgi:hypothetical protein
MIIIAGIASPKEEDLKPIIENIGNYIVPLAECKDHIANLLSAIVKSSYDCRMRKFSKESLTSDQSRYPKHRCLGSSIEVAIEMISRAQHRQAGITISPKPFIQCIFLQHSIKDRDISQWFS